ncbi:UDP-N-acetylglucosamine 2-epimerase [Bacteroidota bacterium]
MNRKICVVSTTRAEYGLLYCLLKAINKNIQLKLQLVVSGMHMEKKFGKSIQQIEDDGFKIDVTFEMPISSDKPTDISNVMAEAMKGFTSAFNKLNPDILVLLGDRYEILSAASAGLILGIPIAHIHGGERTEGVFDEAIRHSVTKMSHLHFAATEEYRNRIIQLGEQPDRVFTVGGLGLENIHKLKLLEKKDIENELNIKFWKKNLLITYHPETYDPDNPGKNITELLTALDELEETRLIFTMPNADPGHTIIFDLINDYVNRNTRKASVFTSLGQIRYLSVLRFVDAVVGNSSSGIIEAPSFKKGTINIGDRQKGRVAAESVINCLPDRKSILNAITKLYSKEFQNKLGDVKNPYDSGNSSEKIIEVLKSYDLKNILKKKFYDIR